MSTLALIDELDHVVIDDDDDNDDDALTLLVNLHLIVGGGTPVALH